MSDGEIVITGNPPPKPPDVPPSPPPPLPQPPTLPPHGPGGPSGGPLPPSGFNRPLDLLIDAMSLGIRDEMRQKPNIDKVEYVAIIWKDSDGILHKTSVHTSNLPKGAPLNVIWNEIDFQGGGKIVAIVHSHPTLENLASIQNPVWTPSRTAGTLSSGDFDQLLDYGAGTRTSFDADNYRSYLYFDGNTEEYYPWQQDKSYYNAGGQADWAVSSSDYLP